MGNGQAPSPAVAGVDVGGTFTDVVLIDGDGHPVAVKVPTTAEDQCVGLTDGLRVAGAERLAAVAHGTTTATNAVLERRVANAVLVTTRGFRDVLEIGRQNRPSLYDLTVTKPPPVIPSERVITVDERIAADGTVIVPLTDAEMQRVVEATAALAPESIAVSLLFSYANDEHERRLCQALVAALGVPVTRSSDLLPEFREYERASTCALDAAVAPVMRRYLRTLDDRLADVDVSVMTSGGGITDLATAAAQPVHTLLSGPAAGVIAAAAVAADAGFDHALAFDMGGTSTDVCLIRDGRPDVATHGTIGGLPFGTPSVAVHTVGAGGGSIAWIDPGGALRVGPRSAGADPGPACYGRGGTDPTVSDAHAVAGHLLDAQPLGNSGLRLDADAARRALGTLPGFGSADEAAEGVVTVVRAAMLRALQRVSTEQGVDPAELALVAYGGAGPLHASALGRELGCAAAIIPPAPGVLSALGLLLAPPTHETSRTVMAAWERDDEAPGLEDDWAELSRAATARIAGGQVTQWADCRYRGQSHELRIARPDDGDLAGAFDAAHRRTYGYDLPGETVEVVTLRAAARATPVLPAPPPAWDLGRAAGPREVEVLLDGRRGRVPLLARPGLDVGATIEGPALITQPDSTTLLLAGDRAVVDDRGALVVRW
ncbi:MAG TPA: hydantoinase/oxoprolinase family protein [Egibacteraceae bacterium]|nr:hydantoinase/oxoprolinase family protein [Egibacteraceae bacterium]